MSTLPLPCCSPRASAAHRSATEASSPPLREWRAIGDLDGERVYGTRDGHLAIEREHAVLVEMTSQQARRWWRQLRRMRRPFPAW